MTRREYAIDLDEAFASELERVGRELGCSAGRALEEIVGELSNTSFSSGATVATADGARHVITSRSTQIRQR